MIPQVVPELEQDTPQVVWQYDSAERPAAGPGLPGGGRDHRARQGVGARGHRQGARPEYTRDAFTNGFLVKLKGSADQIAATLQEVIDYTPDTGGGIGGRAEDGNAEDYFDEAKTARRARDAHLQAEEAARRATC